MGLCCVGNLRRSVTLGEFRGDCSLHRVVCVEVANRALTNNGGPMRHIVYHGATSGRLHAKDDSNPRLLLSSDIQAFQVCREFLEALRTGTHKTIEDANEDLTAYFNHIRREWQANEYYTF